MPWNVIVPAVVSLVLFAAPLAVEMLGRPLRLRRVEHLGTLIDSLPEDGEERRDLSFVRSQMIAEERMRFIGNKSTVTLVVSLVYVVVGTALVAIGGFVDPGVKFPGDEVEIRPALGLLGLWTAVLGMISLYVSLKRRLHHTPRQDAYDRLRHAGEDGKRTPPRRLRSFLFRRSR